jgi:hypothetical protein
MLDVQFSNTSFASQFKFMKMWSLDQSCKDVITNCWNSPVVGSPMFILSTKLKMLKEKLKIWNRETFGNVHDYVKQAESDLADIQNQIQLGGHTDTLCDLEKTAQTKLDDAFQKQNWFWQERARVNWHTEGDRNTSYFHRGAKIKNTTKIISVIRNGDTLLSEPHQIADHVVNYYQNLFCTNSDVLQDELLVEEVIPSLIDDRVNALLTMNPSPSKIKNAVFDLNKDGAPGLDGFGAFFFQNY